MTEAQTLDTDTKPTIKEFPHAALVDSIGRGLLERGMVITPQERQVTAPLDNADDDGFQKPTYQNTIGARKKWTDEAYTQPLGNWDTIRFNDVQKDILAARFADIMEQKYASEYKDALAGKNNKHFLLYKMPEALRKFRKSHDIRDLILESDNGLAHDNILVDEARNFTPSKAIGDKKVYDTMMAEAGIKGKETEQLRVTSAAGKQKAEVMVDRYPYSASANVNVTKPQGVVIKLKTQGNFTYVEITDTLEEGDKATVQSVDYPASVANGKELVFEDERAAKKPEIRIGNQGAQLYTAKVPPGTRLDLSEVSPVSHEGIVRVDIGAEQVSPVFGPKTTGTHLRLDEYVNHGYYKGNTKFAEPLEITVPTAFFTQQDGKLSANTMLWTGDNPKSPVTGLGVVNVKLTTNMNNEIDLGGGLPMLNYNPERHDGKGPDINLRLVAPNGTSKVVPFIRDGRFVDADGKPLPMQKAQDILNAQPDKTQYDPIRKAAQGEVDRVNGVVTKRLKDESAALEAGKGTGKER